MKVYYTDPTGEQHDIDNMSEAQLIVALRRMCRLHQLQENKIPNNPPEIALYHSENWDYDHGQDGF